MRAFIVFLLSLFLLSCATTQSQFASTSIPQEGFGGTGHTSVNDSGFGGTGVVAQADESGFGGTGVIGTIEAFGSIYVNNLHIQIDDKSGVKANIPGTYDLALGQQVMLTTVDTESEIRAEQIQLHFPVSGEVSEVKRNLLIVNGEWVRWSSATQIDSAWSSGRAIEAGEQVIVSGWLQSDGTWMATRLSSNPDAIQQISREMTWPFASEQKQFVVERNLQGHLNAQFNGALQGKAQFRSGRFSSGSAPAPSGLNRGTGAMPHSGRFGSGGGMGRGR